MAFDSPLNSNDQSFDRVLRVDIPVAVLFYPGMSDPALDEALKQQARTNAGAVLYAKIRTDENPQLATRYSVRAPTLITFRDGAETGRVEQPSPDDLRAHTDYLLGRGPKPEERRYTPPRPTDQAPAGVRGDGAPLKVTDATFTRDVLQAQLPVMVDFWAPWCGPCRMIAPALEKLAGEYAGRVRIAKLNVDENPRTQAQYQVQGIPTLLLVKNGRVVDRIVGALPEGQLRTQVERLLKS
jgi:thioredoxin